MEIEDALELTPADIAAKVVAVMKEAGLEATLKYYGKSAIEITGIKDGLVIGATVWQGFTRPLIAWWAMSERQHQLSSAVIIDTCKIFTGPKSGKDSPIAQTIKAGAEWIGSLLVQDQPTAQDESSQ